MRKYSSILLRVGIGMVVLWFGYQQGTNPSSWVGYLPDFTKNLPITQITFIYLNAYFEMLTGALLILGFYTRIISLFMALHMIGIVFSVGYSATGVRDFAIAIALTSIFLHGPSHYSLDGFFEVRENGTPR